MTMKPGQLLAVVGENGSGKSTLVKLLCRLYDPEKGSISIDGIDIRNFQIEDLRKSIGVTFQDFTNYPLSARENIWFGNIQRSDDDPELEEAALLTGASQTIEKLSNQYDSILGSQFKDGHELSRGQWQKIAISRMIFSKAQIFILDEPTSAMDSIAEAKFFKQFKQMIGNKIVFLISHRFSTVSYAHKIYVLKNGSIIEAGSHDDLIKQQNFYYNLYHAKINEQVNN